MTECSVVKPLGLGFSFPYGVEEQVRASAGLVLLNVGESEVTIEQVWKVAADPSSAIAVNAAVALDDQRVIGVANPNFVSSFTDTMYVTDPTTGEQSPVREATDAFVLGASAFDADSEMLFVLDAAAKAVIEYAVDENGFTEVGSEPIAPGLGLPPTAVYLLD